MLHSKVLCEAIPLPRQLRQLSAASSTERSSNEERISCVVVVRIAFAGGREEVAMNLPDTEFIRLITDSSLRTFRALTVSSSPCSPFWSFSARRTPVGAKNTGKCYQSHKSHDGRPRCRNTDTSRDSLSGWKLIKNGDNLEAGKRCAPSGGGPAAPCSLPHRPISQSWWQFRFIVPLLLLVWIP